MDMEVKGEGVTVIEVFEAKDKIHVNLLASSPSFDQPNVLGRNTLLRKLVMGPARAHTKRVIYDLRGTGKQDRRNR